MKPLQESSLKHKRKSLRDYMLRKSSGVNTGIPCIDSYILGLGGLVSIQGETSSCKSALGLQIVHYNLARGTPCLMVDKENGEGRILARLICQRNLISEEQLRQAAPEQQKQYWSEIDSYPMHLHTEPIERLQVFEERVRECWDMYQKPFLVLYDSIQASDKMTDDQRVNLENWVYFLDRLKVEYQSRITIIMISEKNRMSYGAQGTGGGKGSNVVDYKPETIFDIKWNETDDTFALKIAKHRDGPRGHTVHLQKVFSDAQNKRSFCYLLEQAAFEQEEPAV